MKKLLQNFYDIKDIKNIHWRHTLQSIIVFACFCTLDTVKMNNTIWLISATAAVAAIGLLMLLADRINIGIWSNALNIIAADFCIGCYFAEILFPLAIFFVTLTAGIRIIYARSKLNDYSALVFIISSVFAGIVLRFALVLLPVWTLGIFMLATLFNPLITKEPAAQETTANNADKTKAVRKPLIIIAATALVLFFICIEVFGKPLTDEVAHSFPMQMVNLTYLAGYLLFIAALLLFRVKFTSILIMTLAVFGLFFFLMPMTTTFGIYALLFTGGGIKVLMLAFPVTSLRGKYKTLGALSGALIYRLAFLASGVTGTIAGDGWHITSGLTYGLAAAGIALGMSLIFMLAYWDRQELKAEIASRLPKEIVTVKEIIKEVPLLRKPLPNDLTGQERRVAELILKGKSNDEIANELGIKDTSIKSYIARVYIKSGVDGQREFMAMYLGGT